ncbi:MAG: phosphoribosylglycinamide formyltransferase [Alphaproteobacteria bacterium]|nr:phosphoribosylglycinamide formyltransferase [Alphaproteobacteria bacterium]
MVSKKRVAVLISGGGTNLQALMDAALEPDYPARIVLVISNKPDAFGLTRAARAQIPTRVINHRDYPDRTEFDARIQEELEGADIELVCLAGFMRILTPGFVTAWSGRMLNIHPSLLPAYKGLNTHARALADRAERHGCSVHLVEPALDSGPVLVQGSFAPGPDATVEDLAAQVHRLEHRAYPLALSLLASGGVTIDAAGQILIEGAPGPRILKS